MILKNIIKLLEAEFPPQNAMEWDNVGLLLGGKEREIKKVLLTLDITYDIVEQAIKTEADLILSHHPIMFSPVQKITDDTQTGKILMKAAENRISIYAAHTNCDVARGGINAYLAELFQLKNAVPLDETGLGRTGELEHEIAFSDFIELVCEKLKTPHLRYLGDEKCRIKRVAIGSGSCGDYIPAAKELGADVMITGDVKYHEMLDASGFGICVIDAGHYPTEIIVTDIFEKILGSCGLELVKAESCDVFKFI